MTTSASPRPVAEIASELREAIKYFETQGVSLMRGRLRTYADVLDSAANGEAVDRAILWSAVCEVSDLVAAASLHSDALQPVSSRLSSLCGGDTVFTCQSGDDPGRNLCFELITGEMFQRAGAQCKLQLPSDVSATLGEMKLLVECKRPTTLKALGRRVTEGYRQLSEHRRNGHKGFGAIALEISVLVNPQFGVMVAKDATTAMDLVYRHIQKVFQLAKVHLARAARNVRKDAGVHMLLFRVKCMTGDGNGAPNITQVWHLAPTVPLNSPELHALYALMSRQSAFVPGVVVINDRGHDAR